MRYTTPILALLICFSHFLFASAQETVEITFGSGFATNLADLASDAGIASFTSTEIASIENGIKTQLETMFGAFTNTSFSLTSGSGTTILDYGATTTTDGLLGVSPSLDFGNLSVDLGSVTTVSVFSHNFDFIVDEFSGSTSRAAQISQLTTALAGTGGHEIGHSFGLQHHHAYGDQGITPANYGATGGIQNDHVIATGSTGQGETGRETERDFSQWSTLILEAAGGFDAGTFGISGTALAADPLSQVIADVTGGDVGDTAGSATAMSLSSMDLSGFDAAHVGGRLNASSDVDVFSFSIDSAGTLSAEVITDFRYTDDFDSFLTLYDTDGVSVLATNDNARFDGNTFNSGTLRSFDAFLNNISLDAAGTYYLEVSSAGATSGDADGLYSLLVGVNSFSSVPEPTSFVMFMIAGSFVWRRRREQ